MSRATPHLLLAGLGHAHLFVLEALARGTLRDVRVTLVTPPEYDYSGMIPGTVAGCYEPGQARLCPERISRAANAEWVLGRVARIEAADRAVVLDDGSSHSYDLLSVDIGSRPAGDDLPGVYEHAIPVKPVRHVLRLRSAAARATESASAFAPAPLAIVGAGAAGTELAFCLDAALAERFGREQYSITLLTRSEAILPTYPATFREKAVVELHNRGITTRTGTEITSVASGTLHTAEGGSLPFASLLWAAGPRAPSLFRTSGLPTDESGYLRVSPTLQVEGHPQIFAAGDCIAIRGYPWVPKAGVYAVREGPVLARNLALQIRGSSLERYEPQRDWLSLMNTGDGKALLHYKGFTHHGRLAWWLKDRIDRRFVERFQGLAG